MDCFVVEGGRPLAGTVRAAGSKNAVLPLMAAALLPEGETRLERVPRVRDVTTLTELLRSLGASVESGVPGMLRIQAPAEGPTEAPYEVVRRMRASVCVLGPLLARRGRARVSLPGGCVLGVRPIDLHLKGLAALGARIQVEHGTVAAEAPPGGLRGGRVFLSGPQGPSVLGTANVLMAAVLARGVSVLDGVALEPEVQALARFLTDCGARIEGIGSPRLVVEGVEALEGRSVRVPPDRIETGTLLLAGALTGGRVRVEDCRPGELVALLDLLERAGVPLRTEEGPDGGGAVEVRPWERRPRALDVTTRPWPGFPTDLQAQWMAFCTVCEGLALVTETVYPDRFLHVAELNRLGAAIRRSGPTAVVLGPAQLSGAPVLASDLRASACLVLAGLAARGRTTVRRVYHLDRGYEDLDARLRGLGAEVRREPDPEAP